MNKPISVLIAAHNAAETILSAVNSSLSSLDYKDEVLVMLDACSDQTASRLEGIRDKRLRVFESSINLGRSEARNRLANLARNQFVSILDADDVSFPWRYMVTRRLLKKHDAVFGTAILFGTLPLNIPFLPQPPIRISARRLPSKLVIGNPLVHSSATFDVERFSPADLYKEIVAEEYELWMRMALTDMRMVRTAVPLVAYRVHASQASAQPDFYESGLRCEILKNTRSTLEAHLHG